MRQNCDPTAFGSDLDRVRNLTQLAVRQVLTSARAGIRCNDALAECLRAVCSEARDVGLHVEDLIVLIKQAWRSQVEPPTAYHREDETILSDVVTQCIAEYYRDGNDGLRQ